MEDDSSVGALWAFLHHPLSSDLSGSIILIETDKRCEDRTD